jgi:LacI family transcriptional regulator, galactose operon repressor
MAKRIKKNNITISSIADHLSLSVATISYVMNSKTKENGISEETAKRVRKAAREMGYVPNDLARSLRKQKTESIGIVLSDLEQSWAHHTLKGILSVLDPKGYIPHLSVHFWDPEREKHELYSMMKRRMEAIITVPMIENIETYKELTEMGIPLLFLQDGLEECPEVSFCMWDARESAKACVRHLIDTGHTKIGFVGANHCSRWMKMRYDGYKEALTEAGLLVKEHWSCLDHGVSLSTDPTQPVDSGSAIRNLFKTSDDLPNAFLAMNDEVALTTLSVLQNEFNLKVPEQIAVMGMGNLTFSPLIGLSSASEPLEEVGQLAAKIALELAGGNDEKQIRGLVECHKLHLRRTTLPASEELSPYPSWHPWPSGS